MSDHIGIPERLERIEGALLFIAREYHIKRSEIKSIDGAIIRIDGYCSGVMDLEEEVRKILYG